MSDLLGFLKVWNNGGNGDWVVEEDDGENNVGRKKNSTIHESRIRKLAFVCVLVSVISVVLFPVFF